MKKLRSLRPLCFSQTGYNLGSQLVSFFKALSYSSTFIPFASTNFVWKSKASLNVKAFMLSIASKMVNTNDMHQKWSPSKLLIWSGVSCARRVENDRSPFPSLLNSFGFVA